MLTKRLKVLFIIIFLHEYCRAEISLSADNNDRIIVIQDNHIIHEPINKVNITAKKQTLKALEAIITSTEIGINGENVLQDLTTAPALISTLSQLSPTTTKPTINMTITSTATATTIATITTNTNNQSLFRTEVPILNTRKENIISTINVSSTEAPITTVSTATKLLNNTNNTVPIQKMIMPATDVEIDVKKVLNFNGLPNYLPSDCSQRERLSKQPNDNNNASWRKCCPRGEGLNINQSDKLCVPSEGQDYQADILEVVLYDNCIEDMETHPTLPMTIGNHCTKSFVYNSEEDHFVVIQDGSLLVMDKHANESYTIEQKYCLDYDYENNSDGNIYAIICITSVEEHLNRSQVVVVAIFMLISIPWLFLLSYLHVRIKALRTLHGLSLACMSFCLAMGYLLYALAYIFNYTTSKVGGYVTQFFILSYFVWFLCISFNSCLNIWYKFPKQKGLTKAFSICNFFIYLIISIAVSTTLVVMSIQKGLPGMPSYFVQGFTESIRESQRYFIPPVSTILILCFLLIAISFFGFQRIKKLGNENNKSHTNIYSGLDAKFDMEIYGEIKKDAKCISLLWVVMAIAWLLEIVTFYSPGPENYLMFMEILNGLQGTFVLLIFFVVRNRRAMILHWWYDRGTHNLESVEMRTLNNKRNDNN